MFVDGIGVEQVVLHQAGNVLEDRQVGSKHAIDVHAPQLVRDPRRLPDDLHEQAAAADVVPEFVIDQVAVAADGADGVGPHALDIRVLLQQQEDFQQGIGIVAEDAVEADLDEAVAYLETVVERCDFPAAPRVQQFFLEQLQQHFVQPAQFHDGLVVALHERLHPEPVLVVTVAELAGEGALVVEQQAVLAAAGQGVQGKADLPEKIPALDQGVVFRCSQKSVLDQFFQ